MSTPVFELKGPAESAWKRRSRVVVEVLDGVTGEPILEGLDVKVEGLTREPVRSFGGAFVFPEEPGATPTTVSVDPGRRPWQPRRVAVPAKNRPKAPLVSQYSLVTIELAPTPAYLFDTGVTVVRGTLVRDGAESPPVPLALAAPGESIRLQWMDEALPPPGWTDATVTGITNAAGDFAAVLRLGPNQIASTDLQGRLRVRVAVTRAVGTKFSPELQIRPGYVTDVAQKFAWNLFTV